VTRRQERRVGSYWIILRKRGILGTEGGSNRAHTVENSLWRRLWSCRRTDYWMKEYIRTHTYVYWHRWTLKLIADMNVRLVQRTRAVTCDRTSHFLSGVKLLRMEVVTARQDPCHKRRGHRDCQGVLFLTHTAQSVQRYELIHQNGPSVGTESTPNRAVLFSKSTTDDSG